MRTISRILPSPRRGAIGRPEAARRLGLGTLCALVCSVGGGCTGALNSTDHLYGTEPSPALIVVPEGLGDPTDGPSLRAGPGENGWDRRHWDVVVVSVPRGQTETNPAGIGHLPVDQSLPRHRGDFPMDVAVLDTFGDPGDAALDGAVNAAAAPGLLLVGPLLELVLDGRWPWSVVNQPSDRGHFDRGRAYDRLPPTSDHSPWPWLGVDSN